MCTLIIGRDVMAPATVLLAANRDENPARPSEPPGVLRDRPRVVGGRDRVAGGTWLAVRERRAIIAMLNRRDLPGEQAVPASERRSRGLLAIEVATVEEAGSAGIGAGDQRRGLFERFGRISGPGLSGAALERAFTALWEAAYAPFSLVFASPAACWMLAHEPPSPARCEEIKPGWHVLTHMELDDALEPRASWLLRELGEFVPRTVEEAFERAGGLLRSHGGPAAPPVCLHEGRMVTVSSSMIWLGPGDARYLHAEGRPCEQPYADHSHLLSDAEPALESR